MRRIIKGTCPPVLTTRGTNDLHRMATDFAKGQDPIADKNIYAHQDVKTALKSCHNGKCAYCERYLNGDYGAVEHFRPKGGYTDPSTGSLIKPGYWWLSYDWDNLLLSCTECNTSYKRNIFPLSDESQRNISQQDVSQEQPLLINPAVENPSCYLEFNQWIVRPIMINGTEDPKGKKTIEILKLNDRPDLKKKRRDRWYEVTEIRRAGLNDSLWIADDKEFAGMFQNQII